MNLKLIIIFLLLIISCSKEITLQPGTILFEDTLDGTGQEGWRIAPDSFVEHPEYGTVYLIKAANHDSLIPQPWVGDSTWQAYRLEAELLFLEKGSGFIGFDFHVSEDGQRCNNIGFYVGGDLEQPRYVETSVRWNPRNLSWKLWPFSQKSFHLPKDRWMILRIDIGKTIANVYVDNDSLPTYTTYDLLFYSGGIRFWQYFGSVYLRNLRIKALAEDDVQPVLENIWEKVSQLDVIRGWEITPLQPPKFGLNGIPEEINSDEIKWRNVTADRRSIVNLTDAFPENNDKAVIFARTTIPSTEVATRTCWLTYTDRMSLWCNGVKVFDGPARGWYDSGRSEADGFGRLLPDQFKTELNLQAGENTILVRMEINEPKFGSGFWMRLE